jgi:hypothetical protein
LFAGGYKDIFAEAPYAETGLDVWDEVRTYIQTQSPINAQLDGRITTGQAPAALPVAGGSNTSLWSLLILGALFIVVGLSARRRTI